MATKKNKNKKSILDMRLTLIMFALLPMIIVAALLSIVLVNTSSKELKSSTHNSMVSMI